MPSSIAARRKSCSANVAAARSRRRRRAVRSKISGILTLRACAAGCAARQGDVARLLAPLRFAANLALPPRCPGCGAVTGDDHRFCATCWNELRFLAPPWCAACHVPFAYDRGPDALCATCHGKRPRHAGVRAAVAYGDVARTVALRLKYGGRTAFAETVARQMV